MNATGRRLGYINAIAEGQAKFQNCSTKFPARQLAYKAEKLCSSGQKSPQGFKITHIKHFIIQMKHKRHLRKDTLPYNPIGWAGVAARVCCSSFDKT